MVKADGGPVGRNVAVLAGVRSLQMVRRLAGSDRSIVAQETGASDLAMVEADSRPVCWRVTVFAGVRGLQVIGRFACRDGAVVT